MKKGAIQIIVLSLLFLGFMTGHILEAQCVDPAKAEKETIKGTIGFNERLGGYFIQGQEPGGEFFIVNQNKAVLKKLKDKGDPLTIQGHTDDKGAEFFFIETIDGKKYTAKKAAGKKAAPK